MADSDGKFCFAIDRGGTFTDVFARLPDGKERVMKLLSHDPQNYRDAPTEGIRRILQQETGQSFPRDEPLDSSLIGWIRMGTTVATNALLERQGEKMALAVTHGFKHLLHIGTQARPDLFDLEVRVPDVLYEEVIEVDERVVLKQDGCRLSSKEPKRIVKGSTGETLEVWTELDLHSVEKDLKAVLSQGITSLAVLLLHSYMYPDHEQAVGSLARRLGFTQVSLSSEVMPMIRAVPRGYTVCVDAYLTPKIHQYVSAFTSGFEGRLAVSDVDVLFMQSDGGLTPMDQFCGSRAVLSGPAGGVVGYALTAYTNTHHTPVIGFDMGGTSTDVSRYAGQYEHVFESTTAGVTLQAPQLDINTVAAGGGSRLFFRSGMFVVGPESAGAHPGPACYRKGGPLTVTDANLALGRLLPSFFPHIFGPGENEPLSIDETMSHFQKLTKEINHFLSASQSQCDGDNHINSDISKYGKSEMSVEEVAMGFIRVANEAMCRPIRALTQAKGHDTSQHALACFGGAGGQHACAIARTLGMKTVYIHKYSGVLSAYGLALADVVEEIQEPCSLQYNTHYYSELDSRIQQLSQRCHDTLQKRGFSSSQITMEVFLHMRYKGTDCALMISASDAPAHTQSCCSGDFRTAFTARYMKEFGFTIADRPIMVDDIRVRGSGKSGIRTTATAQTGSQPPKVTQMTKCYFEDRYLDTSVFLWEDLSCDHNIDGPAIIIDKNSTILVEPGCSACLTPSGDVCIAVGTDSKCVLGTELNAVQLSIFSHRFMSIAEQMGRVLQRTSISTNIKERLDFSCAVFGPDGGLVSNAPHIPVHLGAMQETVQYQLKTIGSTLKEGDVILSNHPCAGGSHLPDLTVITPVHTTVFREGVSGPVFFVASRGHHADIGGITPGSMPPHSTCLQQEGALFTSFKLVTEGVFQEQAVTEALLAPAHYPGCSGTRNLHDNLSDLRAQVAANQRGSHLVGELIDTYGLDVVQAYMGYIQSNAELAVRDMLREFARQRREQSGSLDVEAEDQMDDGTPIKLRVQINEQEGSAVFDFSGSGPEVWGNCNAPRAITLSALIYCLRCMVGQNIPLNQGCLTPINVIIPAGSILQPSQNAAVVGGNVLTSQRVVDVIFRAFEVCAASQGCMNNITFGNEKCGYYETVGGGAGAGPGWNGRSGVHSHMTNTRITDPEILEKRYPVVLEQFSLRAGSGGGGRYDGGDGLIRKLLFRDEVILSVLTERRSTQPYGLQGGQSGSAGLNLLQRADGRVLNLGAKTSVSLQPGDRFVLHTPGGGGYGKKEEEEEEEKQPSSSKRHCLTRAFAERGSVYEYRRAQESV
ncbi:5-oxoprolinase isoform X1 [Hemibagrus wyckioides]|uniref:5-oxoprolinase isoform X1 n=1 Tax=Hemibagrus wyckioides TaxID=337641 RepID=UPI00266DAFB5|nr:5-oxoprolinase isoform X1 [Hemibagrus wyckioides]